MNEYKTGTRLERKLALEPFDIEIGLAAFSLLTLSITYAIWWM